MCYNGFQLTRAKLARSAYRPCAVVARLGPVPQTRNPKAEARKKAEFEDQNPKEARPVADQFLQRAWPRGLLPGMLLGFRSSDFFSAFDLRKFGFHLGRRIQIWCCIGSRFALNSRSFYGRTRE